MQFKISNEKLFSPELLQEEILGELWLLARPLQPLKFHVILKKKRKKTLSE